MKCHILYTWVEGMNIDVYEFPGMLQVSHQVVSPAFRRRLLECRLCHFVETTSVQTHPAERITCLYDHAVSLN